jgi:glycosyltransferase involved in cell wall biosynthesis
LAISVLYIHHAGTFGGASRSLLEMIEAFPSGSIKPYLITQRGNVAEIFEKKGIPVINSLGISQFDNTRYGYYRKARWALLLREALYFFPTIVCIIRAKKKWNPIDIIHINEITNLLPIIISKAVFKKPVIVHCRSAQQNHSAKIRYRILEKLVNRFCDRIIAIDRTVQESLPGSFKVEVVHNGFNVENRNMFREIVDSKKIDELKNINNGYMKIAMIGNLLKFKGVHEFVKAAKICIAKNLKIIFIFVGSVPPTRDTLIKLVLKKIGLYHQIGSDIYRYIQKNKLTDNFRFIGFTQHIHSIYENIDVLCFPSHLNAVGRPVIEAAFYKVPSIIAITKPLSDTLIDNETGICIYPKDHKALAKAIEYFYQNPSEIKRMGNSAFRLAMKNFNIYNNAKTMLDIYRECSSS